jgi:hypothetical protein
MMGQDRWREGDLGQRFGYSDDGFQLSNSNGNRASFIVVSLDLLDLFSEANKVATQKFGSLWGKSRCTPPVEIDGCMSIAAHLVCVLQG